MTKHSGHVNMARAGVSASQPQGSGWTVDAATKVVHSVGLTACCLLIVLRVASRTLTYLRKHLRDPSASTATSRPGGSGWDSIPTPDVRSRRDAPSPDDPAPATE